MKRALSALVLAAGVGGCMSSTTHTVDDAASMKIVRASGEYIPQKVPGVVGAWGEPIAMAAPYASAPPVNAYQARQMMSQSVPLDWVQMGPGVMQASAKMPGMSMPPGGMMTPPGMPMGPPMMAPGGGMMPPPNMMPGGGKMMPAAYGQPPGAVAGMGIIGASGGMPGGNPGSIGRTQIRFAGPDGMRIAWLTQGQDGKPTYGAAAIEAPGRYNFTQASIYRLKLSGIRGRPGLEIYPTLEVVPCNPKTAAFLAHSAVPIEFTPEDFKEVIEGKYLVKVIYLPDPQFQELAATGTDTIISTRLDPGADPILEAQRRGSILLVIRMGNVDQEATNSPPLDGVGAGGGQCPPGMMPQAMMPPGMMPNPGMMAGPMPPVNPITPPATRSAPSAPQGGNPLPSIPSNPAMPGTVPPSAPGPRIGAMPGNDPTQFRPVSTGQMLPELPPRASNGSAPALPELPGPTTSMAPTGPALAPPPPPVPAALATQTPRN